jgi:hypothetical protein
MGLMVSGLSAVTVLGMGFLLVRIRKVELEVHVGSSEPQPLPMARDMRLREEYVCKTVTAPKTFLIYREHCDFFLHDHLSNWRYIFFLRESLAIYSHYFSG